MPTFAELKKKSYVASHPLFAHWDQRVVKMRNAMQKRSQTGIDLMDIFSQVKQVGLKAGDRTLNAFIQEGAFAAQAALDILDWPLPPQISYNNAKNVKHAKHDESQVVDAEILFNLKISTVSGVRRQATLPVTVAAGEIVPPSTILFEDRSYVLGQGTVNSIVNRNTSYYLEPLRGQFSPPLRNEELDIAVEQRNERGYQAREFSGQNVLTRALARRQSYIGSISEKAEKITDEVYGLISYMSAKGDSVDLQEVVQFVEEQIPEFDPVDLVNGLDGYNTLAEKYSAENLPLISDDEMRTYFGVNPNDLYPLYPQVGYEARRQAGVEELLLAWSPSRNEYKVDRPEQRSLFEQLQEEAGIQVGDVVEEADYDAFLSAAHDQGLMVTVYDPLMETLPAERSVSEDTRPDWERKLDEGMSTSEMELIREWRQQAGPGESFEEWKIRYHGGPYRGGSRQAQVQTTEERRQDYQKTLEGIGEEYDPEEIEIWKEYSDLLAKKYLVTVTYTTVTPESAEAGDFEDTGVESEPELLGIWEVQWAADKWEAKDHEGAAWWYSQSSVTDYKTGEEIEYNLHVKNEDGSELDPRTDEFVDKVVKGEIETELIMEIVEEHEGLYDPDKEVDPRQMKLFGGRRRAQDFEEDDWNVPGSEMGENSDGLLEQKDHDPRKVDKEYKREFPGEKSRKKDREHQENDAQKQKNEKKKEENSGKDSSKHAWWGEALGEPLNPIITEETPQGTTPSTHLYQGTEGEWGGFLNEATQGVFDTIMADPNAYQRVSALASQSLDAGTFARMIEAEPGLGGAYSGGFGDYFSNVVEMGDVDWNALAEQFLAGEAALQPGLVATKTKFAQGTQPAIPSAIEKGTFGTDPTMLADEQTLVQQKPTDTGISQYGGTGDPTGDLYQQIMKQPQILEMVHYAMQEPYTENQVNVMYDAVLPLIQSLGADPHQIDWYGLTNDLISYVGFDVQEVSARKVARIVGRYLMRAKHYKKGWERDPQVVDTVCDAISEWFNPESLSPLTSFYLYCFPSTETEGGKLTIAQDTPGEGWELAAQERLPMNMDSTQMFEHIWKLVQHLPMMPWGYAPREGQMRYAQQSGGSGSFYDNCITVVPDSKHPWVTEWEDTAGAIGEWHAIDNLLSEYDCGDAVAASGMIAVDEDDFSLVLDALDDLGWEYQVGNGCTYYDTPHGAWIKEGGEDENEDGGIEFRGARRYAQQSEESKPGEIADSDSLSERWGELTTPIYRLVDEEGYNAANGAIRQCGVGWIYVDDMDGWEWMDAEEGALLVDHNGVLEEKGELDSNGDWILEDGEEGEKISKRAQQSEESKPGEIADLELQRFMPPGYDVVLGDMVEAEEQGLDTFPRAYAHVEKNYILRRVHTCSKDQWFSHLLNDGFILNPYGPNRGRVGNPNVKRGASKRAHVEASRRRIQSDFGQLENQVNNLISGETIDVSLSELEDIESYFRSDDELWEKYGRFLASDSSSDALSTQERYSVYLKDGYGRPLPEVSWSVPSWGPLQGEPIEGIPAPHVPDRGPRKRQAGLETSKRAQEVEQGHYLDFKKENGNLHMIPTPEGVEFAKECLAGEDTGSDNDILEMFEDHLTYAWELVLPEDINALTDSIILSDEVTRDGMDDIIKIEYVYWNPNYMLEFELDKWAAGKSVIYKGVGSEG